MKLIKRKNRVTIHQPDWIYLVLLMLIIVFGLIMLASAGVSIGYEKYNDPNFFFKRQILWGVLPGLVLFFITATIDYHFWQKIAKYLLLASVLLLVLVFVPVFQFQHGGASRWLDINGFLFQPSELIKLTFLFFLADWFSRSKDKFNDFKEHFLLFTLILGLITLLILLQPDMGTAFVVASIGLIVYFAAGGNLIYLSGLSVAGILSFFVLIKTESYRMKRLLIFLHPELDPLGVGYHMNQALLAIGSGGWWGRGYGLSRQKFMYLPEVVNDSIFAIIAEELGFIFSILVIGLFYAFFYRGWRIGRLAPDMFGKLLAIGISSWFIIQALINIASMVGLMPMTGVPLPFVSYGRSSLLIFLAATGIVFNISKQTKI